MSDSGFLPDGYHRARGANEPRVRAEVEREFADRIANAPDGERKQILAECEREISMRLDKLAPPDAHY